jgi:hypothetical protein
MDISVGISITHSGSGAGIGSSVSAAGDVNGDGVNDIVIGSYTVEAFVIYGGSNITNMDFMNLDMSRGYSISSSLSQSIVDFRVVGNIDVNHDDISDIAIGCPYDNIAERVYVIYGTYNRYRSNVILEYLPSSQGLVIVTSDLNDKSGYYISSSGDYNNDTYGDLLVSASYAFNKVGAVYVITNALSSNTRSPTLAPNTLPKPSKRPSTIPTVKPSRLPSARPSKISTLMPSKNTIVQPNTNGLATSEPSIDPSCSYTSEPSENNILNMTLSPSCIPTKTPVIKFIRPTKYPSDYPSLSPTTNLVINTNESMTPISHQLSYSPSLDPTYMQSSFSNKTSNSSLLDASDSRGNDIYIKISVVSIIMGPMITFTILILFYNNFRYIYKYVMKRLGYDFIKPMKSDTSVSLRIASLDDCIQYFWEYRGVIYKRGTVTNNLFSRMDDVILNALDDICMNPNILCPVSYYKVVCHMADRKSDAIRNKAYETLLICKLTMSQCVTVECIQLLRRMFIDCGRIDVKEHAVTMLCEISHSNPNLITFDIYDMLRSYNMTTSVLSLLHAIEITLQEISQHCVHLYTQIDEYEKSLLPTCYYNNNDNIQSDACKNKHNNIISEQLEVVERYIYVQSHTLNSEIHRNSNSDTSENDCLQYINNFLESEYNGNLSDHNRLNNVISTENNLVSEESDLVHDDDFGTYIFDNIYTETLISIESNNDPAISNDSSSDDSNSESDSSNKDVIDDMITNFVTQLNDYFKVES